MQTCPKCGRENAVDARFCSNCGAALSAEPERPLEAPCRNLRGRMRLAKRDATGAGEDAQRALDLSEEAKDPQVRWPALAFAARAFLDVMAASA